MVTEISVFDSEEFEELISQRDLRISKALVETILKNLKGRKRQDTKSVILIRKRCSRLTLFDRWEENFVRM